MRTPNPTRDELRKALEHDLAAYLEAGGAVQTIEPGVVALPPGGAKDNSHLFLSEERLRQHDGVP